MDSIDERWREKYYDKCEELNAALKERDEAIKLLKQINIYEKSKLHFDIRKQLTAFLKRVSR